MVESRKSLEALEATSRPSLSGITVVIPTLGRPILEESLYWIATGSAWPARLIVVDQGSDASVAAWLTRLERFGLATEHVRSSQRGKASALNRGIERVRTRFLAVTDDDCFVDPDWLERMVAMLQDNPEAVITGPARPEGDEEVVSTVTARTAVISRRPGLKFDMFCGSNMGAAKAVIDRVGWFDEDLCLVAAEDCEWAYRVLRNGVPIIYDPEMGVRHFGWRDAAQRGDRQREYARSLGGFYGKYLRRGDWFVGLRLAISLFRIVRRSIRGLVTNRRQPVYLAEFFVGIKAGWRRGGLT